jgi:chromosome partitioning protein
MLDRLLTCQQHPVMTTTHAPTIISFVSPKGGVGKSTSCLALASALAHKGEKVQIIDFDQTETLWRWYSANEAARNIPNLTVEKGPDNDLGGFINEIWNTRSGFVFIDLAGSLTHQMLLMATFAHLTITPSKPSEPDIVEASKLAAQLQSLATKLGKPILHRILLNEVPALLQTHQAHIIDQIDASNLQRFENIMHTRAAFPETWLTGVPPHFADQSRAPVQKAVNEIDLILGELLAALSVNEQRQAA